MSDTGSRRASAPPIPGIDATAEVKRPTRATHQWSRSSGVITSQRGVPGSRDVARRSSARCRTLPAVRRAFPARVVGLGSGAASEGADSSSTARRRASRPSRNGSASRSPDSTGPVAATKGRNTLIMYWSETAGMSASFPVRHSANPVIALAGRDDGCHSGLRGRAASGGGGMTGGMWANVVRAEVGPRLAALGAHYGACRTAPDGTRSVSWWFPPGARRRERRLVFRALRGRLDEWEVEYAELAAADHGRATLVHASRAGPDRARSPRGGGGRPPRRGAAGARPGGGRSRRAA